MSTGLKCHLPNVELLVAKDATDPFDDDIVLPPPTTGTEDMVVADTPVDETEDDDMML